MPIHFTCPGCGAKAAAPDDATGKLVQCPKCQHQVRLTPPAPPQPSITFYCSSCQGSVTGVPGTKVFCPACRQKLLVPAPPPVPATRNKTVLGELEQVPTLELADEPEPAATALSRDRDLPRRRPRHRNDFDDDDRPRRRRDIDDEPVTEGSGAVHSLGIASMVVGAISLPMSMVPCLGIVGLPLGVLGFLLGFGGNAVAVLRGGRGVGFGIAGLGLNGMAILFAVFWLFLAEAALKPR